MPASLKYLPRYSFQDYLLWEGKWELIYGVPYSMAPTPGYTHQRINSRILGQLLTLLKDCKQCEPLMPLDYKVADDVVLQPDVLVVCEPYEKGTFITKTPEMVFEILSPSTREKDLNLKFNIYEQKGVKYYIIIDPDNRLAFIYLLNEEGKYKLSLKTESDFFDFDLSPCPFRFDFGEIW